MAWIRHSLFAVILCLAGSAATGDIGIDFAKPTGQTRALHGANCGPLQYGD